MGLFGPSAKDILETDQLWSDYLQASGINSQLLRQLRTVELNYIGKKEQYAFNTEQFWRAFLKEQRSLFSKKRFDVDFLVDILVGREGWFASQTSRAFFSEGPQKVVKKQETFRGVKESEQPARNFLRLEGEKLNKLPSPTTESGCWPLFNYCATLFEGGYDIYDTGERIIFDGSYTEGERFGTASFWGEIDLRGCANLLGRPYLTLLDARGKRVHTTKIRLKQGSIPVSGKLNVYIPFLGGGMFNVPGTKRECATLDNMLIDAQNREHLKTRKVIGVLTKELHQAIGNLKPVDLDNILAMWHYAVQNKLLTEAGEVATYYR